MSKLPPSHPGAVSAPSGGAGIEVDIDAQLKKTLEILQREVTWLLRQSSIGKLDSASARDLVNYVKLLSELQRNEKDWLKDLSTEDLAELLKERDAKAE